MELKNFLEFLSDILKNVNLNAFKILLGVVISLTCIYLGKIWYSYGFFKKRGIKTPKYKFISGNLKELIQSNYSEVLQNWTKQYGKVYGYYEGHLPIMVTSDLEIIRQVFIKQFSNFTARKKIPFQENDDGPNINLFLASGNRWKRMKTILNPTFSPAKLKQLLPEMKKSWNRLANDLDNNLGKEINFVNYLDSYTMDIVWNTAFGLDINCIQNPNNLFLKKGNQYFREAGKMNYNFVSTVYFPEFRPIIIKLMSLIASVMDRIDSENVNPWFWLIQNMKFIIEKRIANNVVKNDYVQILLDTQAENTEINELEKNEKPFAELKLEKKLTLNEIRMNLMAFLLAGFETTSAVLTLCIYVLLQHPEELTKLRDEIDQHYPPGSDIEPSYENMLELEYLDLFVKEVLRMYPVTNDVIARRCTNATRVNDTDIPIGLVITADILSLHYDPEIWGPVDPNEFYPLRFADEDKKNTLAYMPFGIGPRICIGLKFALMELKLTLIRILQNYDLLKTENTPLAISFTEGFTRRPKNDLKLILEKRKFYA